MNLPTLLFNSTFPAFTAAVGLVLPFQQVHEQYCHTACSFAQAMMSVS
jgi:hypothetical protein